MKIRLQFISAVFIVLAVYLPVVYGQANLTFDGGNGTPISITLRRSVTYTITDSDCSLSGPIFIFDEAGNSFTGLGPLVAGDIAFSVNSGTLQTITNANSGVSVNDVTASDIFIYGNLANNLTVGNTVVLSRGTVTTTTNIFSAPPADASLTTFLTNDSGVRCSSDGIAIGPTAAPVSVSGRVLTGKGRGLANAFVYLTDQEGNTKISRTNPFGYYRFADVPSGQTATVIVVSKQYQFAPRIVSLNDAVPQLDFIAEP